MWDKIKKGEDRLEVHGVYPAAVPHIADMWENEPYNGYVINNLPTMHYRVAYFDDMLKDLEISKRAMDMASEMGYDTMEIGSVHIGKRHGLGTDIYFYNSDEE